MEPAFFIGGNMANLERDVYLARSGGTTMGFLLRKTAEGKSYMKTLVPDAVPPFSAEMTKGISPAQEFEWFLNSWHKGAGFDQFTTEGRFAESCGVDVREYGQLSLARLPVTVTGAMDSGTDRYFAIRAGTLYCGTGTELWELTGATTWTQRGASTAQAITSLAAIGQYVCVGQATGNFYIWDSSGSTLTQKGVPRVKMFVERDVVWGNDGVNIYSTDDPTTDASWTTAITIGESGSTITNIGLFNTYLTILKTDGVYLKRNDGAVKQPWGATVMQSSENGKHAVTWRNNLVFSVVGNRLFLLAQDDTITDVSPSVWGDYDVGVCNGLAATPDYLAAIFGGDLWIGWIEVIGESQTVMRWFKLTDEPSCDGCIWHSSRLYYGKAAATNYIPFLMTPEPTTVGRTSGWLSTSKNDFGYPDRLKVGYKCSWRLSACPTGTTVLIQYIADGGSPVTITTISATAGYGSATITPFSARQIQLKVTITGDASHGSPVVEWIKFDGYVIPRADLFFSFDVAAEDFDDTTGKEYAAHLFAAATDTLPPTLTDKLGNTYLIRFESGYPQEMVITDDEGREQSIVRVQAWEIRDT